jgi:hypothetical protein
MDLVGINTAAVRLYLPRARYRNTTATSVAITGLR